MVTRVGKYVGGLGIDLTGKLDVLDNATVTVGNGTTTGNLFIGGNVGIGSASTNNKISISGSFSRGAPVIKTSSFTLADTENFVICNSTSPIIVTIPLAVTYLGREFTIKSVNTGIVYAMGANVSPIASLTPTANIMPAGAGKWATLVSNGSHWVVMANA